MIYNGKHVMIDAVILDGRRKSALHDSNVGRHFLEGIIDEIDMTMVLPVITVHFPHSTCEMNRVLGQLGDEGLEQSTTAKKIREALEYRKTQSYGYSSFAMIAESHLSLHTFPEDNFFTFDCYSCKDFPEEAIKAAVQQFFGDCKMSYQVVSRFIPQV
jgi:S-adenosylmethionine decarboxylase